jgi:hypothetical protein
MMAQENHLLTQYIMTDQEEANAALLNEGQLRMIKNFLATDSMRLMNLVPLPNDYSAFIQEHAEIKGAISAWQHLLNVHEDTVRRLAT